MLVGQDLSCTKRDRLLFENLQIEVGSGQFWYVKGPNGAGKTSLLRILANLTSPTEGQLTWQGEPFNQAGRNYHKDMVYVGHKTGLNQQLSAVENVLYWSALNGLNITSAYDVLAELGLVGLEDMPIRQLSEGQQRRVALTRLWIKEAKIWILDEPYAALDVLGIQLLNTKIDNFIESGGSVVMTSHQEPLVKSPIQLLTLAYQL